MRDGFVGIHLEWQGHLYFFINIYSACDIRSKRKLWNDLRAVRTKFTGENGLLSVISTRLKMKGKVRVLATQSTNHN